MIGKARIWGEGSNGLVAEVDVDTTTQAGVNAAVDAVKKIMREHDGRTIGEIVKPNPDDRSGKSYCVQQLYWCGYRKSIFSRRECPLGFDPLTGKADPNAIWKWRK